MKEYTDDYISRKAVIDITAETGALTTHDRVCELPSIQPKHGYWISEPDEDGCFDQIECSCCHSTWNLRTNQTYKFDFCPSCGADMKSDEEIKGLSKAIQLLASYNTDPMLYEANSIAVASMMALEHIKRYVSQLSGYENKFLSLHSKQQVVNKVKEDVLDIINMHFDEPKNDKAEEAEDD